MLKPRNFYLKALLERLPFLRKVKRTALLIKEAESSICSALKILQTSEYEHYVYYLLTEVNGRLNNIPLSFGDWGSEVRGRRCTTESFIEASSVFVDFMSDLGGLEDVVFPASNLSQERLVKILKKFHINLALCDISESIFKVFEILSSYFVAVYWDLFHYFSTSQGDCLSKCMAAVKAMYRFDKMPDKEKLYIPLAERKVENIGKIIAKSRSDMQTIKNVLHGALKKMVSFTERGEIDWQTMQLLVDYSNQESDLGYIFRSDYMVNSAYYKHVATEDDYIQKLLNFGKSVLVHPSLKTQTDYRLLGQVVLKWLMYNKTKCTVSYEVRDYSYLKFIIDADCKEIGLHGYFIDKQSLIHRTSKVRLILACNIEDANYELKWLNLYPLA